jgi:hypothetical protein
MYQGPVDRSLFETDEVKADQVARDRIYKYEVRYETYFAKPCIMDCRYYNGRWVESKK